jgi:hypothetical protein
MAMRIDPATGTWVLDSTLGVVLDCYTVGHTLAPTIDPPLWQVLDAGSNIVQVSWSDGRCDWQPVERLEVVNRPEAAQAPEPLEQSQD